MNSSQRGKLAELGVTTGGAPGAIDTADALLSAKPAGARQTYHARLGHFVILSQLGAGGMGAVYAAYDEKLDRKVALKLLHARGGEQGRINQRLLREAKALARVAHPRVVSVYEVGEADSQVYLAMEFVDGITLRTWQSRGRRSWQEILDVYLPAGEGLHAAHQAGVVHRDFKPDNVLVGADGQVRVVDFGIAFLGAQADGALLDPGAAARAPGEPNTAEGPRAGTSGYMSPEHCRGESVSAASDQWSFCASLFEALYGSLPSTSQEHIDSQPEGGAPTLTPPPPGSPLPLELFHILSRGLAADAGQRFPSMAALLRALRAEREQLAAASGLLLRMVLGGLILGVILTTPAILFIAARQRQVAGPAIWLSAVLISIMLAVGYMHRGALRRNKFHRQLWSLLLLMFVQNMCLRALFAFRYEMPHGSLLSIEMVGWTGMCIIIAGGVLPRLWWLPGIPIATCIANAMLHPPPRQLLLWAYPLIVATILWGWRREAQRTS